MGNIEAVLERLVADPDFRVALARDPGAALLPYDLTADEVALLASRLDDGDDTQRAVEQRTSKSALLAAVAMLDGGDGMVPGSGVGHDETLTAGGDRSEAVGVEYTKVPAPPAPPVPVPYPNTAEVEVTMESLEVSAEGFELDHEEHDLAHVQLQGGDGDAGAVKGPIKYGDITLKRGVVDEPATGPDDVVGADDGGSEVGGHLTMDEVEGKATDEEETVEAGDTLVHDWQPSGARAGVPPTDVSATSAEAPIVDDVLEIDDA